MEEIVNAIKQFIDLYEGSLSPDWINIICDFLSFYK